MTNVNFKKYVNASNVAKGLKVADGIVWGGVSVVAGLCAIKLLWPFKKKVEVKQTDIYRYTYADAVNAISNSSMADSDKGLAIKALAYGLDSDIYSAIEDLVDSNMASSSKVEAIKVICGGDSQ